MRAHGTITSSPSRRADAREATLFRQRAPSSVVEHVTFNHGVPGSIPGGPSLRSSVITRRLSRRSLALQLPPSEGGPPPVCERATAWQAILRWRSGVARCYTPPGDPVTHRLLTKRHVCRHQRLRSRGTTVALGCPIPRVRTWQLRPVSP